MLVWKARKESNNNNDNNNKDDDDDLPLELNSWNKMK